LGTRKKLGEKVGDYEFVTYEQVRERRNNLASGFINLGFKTDEPIGLYSINRPEWIISDLACTAIRAPSVALYDTLGKSAVEYIIRHADISVVICSAKQFTNVLSCIPNCPKLKFLIHMDPITQDQLNSAEKLGAKVISLKEVEELGQKNPKEHFPLNQLMFILLCTPVELLVIQKELFYLTKISSLRSLLLDFMRLMEFLLNLMCISPIYP
jgi:long-chain acyl-CoA synthetase